MTSPVLSLAHEHCSATNLLGFVVENWYAEVFKGAESDAEDKIIRFRNSRAFNLKFGRVGYFYLRNLQCSLAPRFATVSKNVSFDTDTVSHLFSGPNSQIQDLPIVSSRRFPPWCSQRKPVFFVYEVEAVRTRFSVRLKNFDGQGEIC